MKRDQGFTLVELLVSTSLAFCITAAILAAVLRPRACSASSEAADMQQRLAWRRTVLFKDLMIAGAGTDAGANAGPLSDALPPIMPFAGASRRRRPRHLPKRRDHAAARALASTDHDRQRHAARSGSVRANSGVGCPLTDGACGLSGARMALILRRRRFVRSVSHRPCPGVAHRSVPPNGGLHQDLPGWQPDCRGSRADLFPEGRRGSRHVPVDAGRRRRPSCDTGRGPCRATRLCLLRRSQPPMRPPPPDAGHQRTSYPPGENCVVMRDELANPVPRLPCSMARPPAAWSRSPLGSSPMDRGAPTSRPSIASTPISSGSDRWPSHCDRIGNRRAARPGRRRCSFAGGPRPAVGAFCPITPSRSASRRET